MIKWSIKTLYSGKYKEYLLELEKDKFYDENKLHRIDSTLLWNVTFCYFKLYGNNNNKTIESIKKSIKNHQNILYININKNITRKGATLMLWYI